MNPKTLNTSSAFFNAAASYFGLPPDQLVLGGQVGVIGGTFRISIEMAITPDDLIGITNRMKQLDQHRASQALDSFIGKPRAGMSEAQSAAFDAEGLTGTWREPSTEGVGGRKVAHVEVPKEEGDAGLPASVWVRDADLMRSQVGLASDTRNENGPEYLLQVSMLTDEQKAKYGVAS
jgi:hypothetical protein